MITEEFESALDEIGILHRRSGNSVVVQDCPACGSDGYKVIFDIRSGGTGKNMFGKCLRGSCGEKFSSAKYFSKMGVTREKNFAFHGMDFKNAIKESSKTDDPGIVGEIRSQKTKNIEEIQDVSKFIRINQWPDHPASKYAIKRGIDPVAHKDIIMIDHENNAVIFLVKKNGNIIGYQSRFVNPTNPRMKTKTSKGFPKENNVMEVPSSGRLLICEGPFTAISGWHFGFHSICVFGAPASKPQLDIVYGISVRDSKEICVSVENDEAGFQFWNKIGSFFFWKGIKIKKIVTDKKYGDLNDAWMDGAGFVESEEEFTEESVAIPKIDLL